MSLLDRHECALACCSYVPVDFEGGLHCHATTVRRDHPCTYGHFLIDRSGALQDDMEVAGDGAWQLFEAVSLHEVVGGSPVGVAVEKSSTDAPIEDVAESDVVSLRLEPGDQLITFRKALDLESLVVVGPTAETAVVGSQAFLQALHAEGG